MNAPRAPFGERPPHITERVAQDFARASNPETVRNAYTINGTPATSYFWYWSSHNIKQRELFEAVGHGNGAPALDIGTGAGNMIGVLDTMGYQAQGVSAIDYRTLEGPGFESSKRYTDDQYLVGDAHNLRAVPGIRSEYGLIVSNFCLRHLRADPLSMVVDAANMLPEGGVLAVDDLVLPMVYDNVDTSVAPATVVVESLYEAGFDPLTVEVEEQVSRALYDMPYFLPSLVLRRRISDRSVELPLYYGNQDDRATYFTTPYAQSALVD